MEAFRFGLLIEVGVRLGFETHLDPVQGLRYIVRELVEGIEALLHDIQCRRRRRFRIRR